MRTRSLSAMLAILLAALACNLPSSPPTDETASPTPVIIVVSATPLPASETPLPADTPLPTLTQPPPPTATPTVPIAWPKDVPVNCRLGPSQAWIVLSGLQVGQTSQIVGKNSAQTWWYIVDPENSSKKCWVSVSVTNAAGNLSGIPIVSSPEASVTKVNVTVTPKTISVAGCIGPIQPLQIKGSIEVNGPATVKWHFATEQGGAMSTKTLEFDAYGEKNISSSDYTPPLVVGTYWVRLVITSPNDIQDEVKYEIECP